MTTEKYLEIASEEEERWIKTHDLIETNLKESFNEFQQDRQLARALTAEIVATTRDEEKSALASDEAVAHGLTKLRSQKTKGLEELFQQPYFARVVTEENGRQIEFKLGTAALPEARIIDWRKAPISKLYYDYKQGEEFCVTIQGREREGEIKIRRGFNGEKKHLSSIEIPDGLLVKTDNQWQFTPKNEVLSRSDTHDGHLPPILSLITPEQFALITRDAEKPLIIQGIAGSGKTTVALHRLAWLLHEDNSNCRPNKCLVVMLNRSLKAYVETTLPELNIKGVPIKTYHSWVNELVGDIAGFRARGEFQRNRNIELFKSSVLCLSAIEDYFNQQTNRNQINYIRDLFNFFVFLLNNAANYKLTRDAQSYLQEQISKQQTDYQDDSLILQLVYMDHGYYPTNKIGLLNILDHLVIDEAQDFGALEIKTLLNALDAEKTVTIVGDRAQKIVEGRHFGSWEELLKSSGFGEVSPLVLNVSHRSTEEVMELAHKLREDGEPFQTSGRHGPSPVYIRCDNPADVPRMVGKWIDARLLENKRTYCAVICRTPKQAQELVADLRRLGYPSVRLGHRDQFEFSPGITITNVHQVKGLEFNNVLIVEPTADNYKPSLVEEKNLLYVAITRALIRLDFVGSKAATTFLPKVPQVSGANVHLDQRS